MQMSSLLFGGKNFFKFLAALAILHQDDFKISDEFAGYSPFNFDICTLYSTADICKISNVKCTRYTLYSMQKRIVKISTEILRDQNLTQTFNKEGLLR